MLLTSIDKLKFQIYVVMSLSIFTSDVDKKQKMDKLQI